MDDIPDLDCYRIRIIKTTYSGEKRKGNYTYSEKIIQHKRSDSLPENSGMITGIKPR